VPVGARSQDALASTAYNATAAPAASPRLGTAQTVAGVPTSGRPTSSATPAVAATPAPTPAPDAFENPLPDVASGPIALDAGTVVGEYRVTAKIGEGGMGEVYSGVHPVIGKKVAIKLLNAALSQDPSIVQRFVQEARAVNQIGHRNIVDIFAFGQLNGRSYFVMEFLGGRSLRQRLDESPPLSYRESVTILLEVCAALAAAHAEQIVHRDLKPDNVFLVESKGGDRTVKLLDFGIAKLLQREGGAQNQTSTGVPMGTPLYMSPEQCLGRGVDSRTDVYSLGVMMFEMFTGRLPFAGQSYIETVTGHLSQPPPNPRDLAEMPEALASLILRCLEKDAAARPQRVEDVRAELEQVAAELGPEMRRPTNTGLNAVSSPVTTPSRRTPMVSGEMRPTAAKRPIKPWQVFTVSGVVAGFIMAGALVVRRPAAKPMPATTAAPVELPPVELQVVSEPQGAFVIIDGKKQSLLTNNVYKVPRARSYTVRVEKAGFDPYEEKVQLADGQTQLALNPALHPSKLPAGGLVVRTNVKKASWKLDGGDVGDGSGTLAVKDLAPGSHRVSVNAKGYQLKEESLEVKSKDTASYDWSLTAVATSAPHHHGAKPASTSAAPVDDSSTSGWPPSR
jgi:serine/threonine-protein kinase